MRSLLFSPRARRRLAWIGAGVAVVAGTVAAGVMWPSTTEEEPNTFSAEEAYVYREPEEVELTRTERARALATAANFVTHAVARQRVELAYDLVGPDLKAGMTRAQWRKGTIPVVPFPVQEARWKVEYSYGKALGLQVLLLPTPKSKLRPAVFAMELTPTGKAKPRRWQVASWAPTGMTGAGAAAPPQTTGPGGVPNIGASLSGGEARLDTKWLLAPVALLLLVPLIVSAFYLRSWRRGRRAAAAYREQRAVR